MAKRAKREKQKSLLGRIWYFIWEDNSIWSWIVNIILAFILIKFVVYPGLGFLLGTSYPIVAVVSSSMEHQGSFEEWWANSASDYAAFGITKEEFREYPLKSGFDRGDIIILRKFSSENLKRGDVIVYWTKRPDPIIHRVVAFDFEKTGFIQTKGDNYRTNRAQIVHYVDAEGRDAQKGAPGAIKFHDETEIKKDEIIGKAWIRIPLLGYVKIFAVELWNSVRG